MEISTYVTPLSHHRRTQRPPQRNVPIELNPTTAHDVTHKIPRVFLITLSRSTTTLLAAMAHSIYDHPFDKLFHHDIISVVAPYLIAIADRPVNDLHALLSMTPHLEETTKTAMSSLWRHAHDLQYGPLPPELAAVVDQAGFSWRAFALKRVRVASSPVAVVAMAILREYRLCVGIR